MSEGSAPSGSDAGVGASNEAADDADAWGAAAPDSDAWGVPPADAGTEETPETVSEGGEASDGETSDAPADLDAVEASSARSCPAVDAASPSVPVSQLPVCDQSNQGQTCATSPESSAICIDSNWYTCGVRSGWVCGPDPAKQRPEGSPCCDNDVDFYTSPCCAEGRVATCVNYHLTYSGTCGPGDAGASDGPTE